MNVGRLRLTRFGALSLLVTAALSGCMGSDETPSKLVDCRLIHEDQRGSFMARVDGFPIPLVIDTNFSSTEREQVMRAIDEWNAHGAAVRGGPFFSSQVAEIPSANRALDVGACEEQGRTDGTLYLVRESRKQWSLNKFPGDALAVTQRCHSTTESRLLSQVIVVNQETIPSGHFMSVVLHELGHALGLDHSCTMDQGSQNFRACAGLDGTHPYYEAVMFPKLVQRQAVVSSVDTFARENIRINDKIRAQCLYGDVK